MRPLLKKAPDGTVIVSHDGGASWAAAPAATGTVADAITGVFGAITDSVTGAAGGRHDGRPTITTR